MARTGDYKFCLGYECDCRKTRGVLAVNKNGLRECPGFFDSLNGYVKLKRQGRNPAFLQQY